MKWSLLFLFVCFFSGAVLHSQTALTGKVVDESDEPLIAATVKAFKGTEFYRGTITDYDGRYRIELDASVFNLECTYVGYFTSVVLNASMDRGQNTIDFVLQGRNGPAFEGCWFGGYKIPLINIEPRGEHTGFNTFTSEQLRRMVR